MIAVLYSDGDIQLQTLRFECGEKKWAPVLVYRKPGDPTPIVITFNNEDMVRRFAKRNLDKNWMRGAVHLEAEGIEYIKAQGWKIELMEWPRLMTGFELGYEVVNFESKLNVSTARA